jgi:hypothetical protein
MPQCCVFRRVAEAGRCGFDNLGSAALASLPVVRKSDLIELQKTQRPFGGLAACAVGQAGARVRLAGPDLRTGGTRRGLLAHLARALYAAGFRAGDLVHNTFSYHFTPAGSMMEPAHAGLHGVSRPASARPSSRWRRWPTCAGRLRRHAVLPAHPAGEGRRAGRRAAVVDQGASSPARPSCRRCAKRCCRAASPATRPTPRRTSA